MRLVAAVPEAIDSRRVTPDDVVDAITGVVDGGQVEHMIVITESPDGELLFITTDMTNTQFVGTLSIALQNYIHTFQHQD